MIKKIFVLRNTDRAWTVLAPNQEELLAAARADSHFLTNGDVLSATEVIDEDFAASITPEYVLVNGRLEVNSRPGPGGGGQVLRGSRGWGSRFNRGDTTSSGPPNMKRRIKRSRAVLDTEPEAPRRYETVHEQDQAA
jgi:hypothetical protein